MEANARNLEQIFDGTIQFQVPLFQRPYVWSREKNWEPLWDDIEALLAKHLRGRNVHPHFLGAVVLEQLANPTGSIQSRQVIDGQQRFTTLQLFLIAARDVAHAFGSAKFSERFGDLAANRPSKIDKASERFKVWPTNSDRAAFRVVHESTSPDALRRALVDLPDLASDNIVCGYQYFHEQLLLWFAGTLDDPDDAEALSQKSSDDRLESLWHVAKACLQIVVIDLDKDDETQVIFETLNARGEDLLPADLIKNYLFRRVVNEQPDIDVERLFNTHWHALDEPFWRVQVKQGRISRPRIDIFVNHFLTLMTRDDVKSTHLFNAFKSFAQGSEPVPGSLIPFAATPAEHIAQLARYAKVFQKFFVPGAHHRLAQFLGRLEALDTTTVYPFLLHAYSVLMPSKQGEFDGILNVLESYLIRRMVCGMTTRAYNRLFVDLIRSVEAAGDVSIASVGAHLGRSASESTRSPSDGDVLTAVLESPIYSRIAQYKLRLLLEALDQAANDRKSEAQPLPAGLTIEHVMPARWEQHWPLDPAISGNPVLGPKAVARRNTILNTLGNLTLITGSLNPSLYNEAWSLKRPELLKFSKLNLNRYFHGPHADTWDEQAILLRGTTLANQLIQIWPQVR